MMNRTATTTTTATSVTTNASSLPTTHSNMKGITIGGVAVKSFMDLFGVNSDANRGPKTTTPRTTTTFSNETTAPSSKPPLTTHPITTATATTTSSFMTAPVPCKSHHRNSKKPKSVTSARKMFGHQNLARIHSLFEINASSDDLLFDNIGNDYDEADEEEFWREVARDALARQEEKEEPVGEMDGTADHTPNSPQSTTRESMDPLSPPTFVTSLADLMRRDTSNPYQRLPRYRRASSLRLRKDSKMELVKGTTVQSTPSGTTPNNHSITLPTEIVSRILSHLSYSENEVVFMNPLEMIPPLPSSDFGLSGVLSPSQSSGFGLGLFDDSRPKFVQHTLTVEQARRGTQRDLLECALVSRCWAVEALRLLWREVPIRLHGLASLGKSERSLVFLAHEKPAMPSLTASFPKLTWGAGTKLPSEPITQVSLLDYASFPRHLDVEIVFPSPNDGEGCARLTRRLSLLSRALGTMKNLQSTHVCLAWVPGSLPVMEDDAKDAIVSEPEDLDMDGLALDLAPLGVSHPTTTGRSITRKRADSIEGIIDQAHLPVLASLLQTPAKQQQPKSQMGAEQPHRNPWHPLRSRIVRLFSGLTCHPTLRNCDVEVTFASPTDTRPNGSSLPSTPPLQDQIPVPERASPPLVGEEYFNISGGLETESPTMENDLNLLGVHNDASYEGSIEEELEPHMFPIVPIPFPLQLLPHQIYVDQRIVGGFRRGSVVSQDSSQQQQQQQQQQQYHEIWEIPVIAPAAEGPHGPARVGSYARMRQPSGTWRDFLGDRVGSLSVAMAA